MFFLDVDVIIEGIISYKICIYTQYLFEKKYISTIKKIV